MSDAFGRCCYGGMKPKRACASCAAWGTGTYTAEQVAWIVKTEVAYRDMEIERLRAEIACWRTNGRSLRLSDPEMAETMAKLKHRIKTDKDFARRLLNDAGIVGKDGKLSPMYRA